MYEFQYKPKKLKYDSDNKLVIPSMDSLVEVSDFLQDLFEVVIQTQDAKLLATYNKIATQYNAKANHISFINFQNPSQMATAKKVAAAKEAQVATKTKTVATKKVAATVTTDEVVEKPKSQKEIVIEEAAAGLTINEIVEKHSFIKTNVAWYFSKYKLHAPKPAKAEVEALAETVTKKVTAKKAKK